MSKRRKLLVVDCAAMGWDVVSHSAREDGVPPFRRLETVFPAVTCTVQASFRTAAAPRHHGMVSNGLYFRNLRKPLFWEQAAALVTGDRIWKTFRARGRRVGMLFWQQSLGEEVDVVLSPRPIHKHGGGMIQDCYSQPPDLYARLCALLGRRFNLVHYWGPLASRKSSDWIVEATEAVMAMPDLAPDLLLSYIPHLDYDLQRHGPDSAQARTALAVLRQHLRRLDEAARRHGYETLIFGDYAMRPITGGAVFPNRALREAGLFLTRRIGRRDYPDFFSSPAVAIVDHEMAQVMVQEPSATQSARELLAALPGVGAVLDRKDQRDLGVDHPAGGELLLVADDGYWFAYPWWTDRRAAPDFATHVDIHNKPGYDPCELFFGWPPLSVSMNTARVRGSHGRTGPGRETAWYSSITWTREPRALLELAENVKEWLDANV